MVLNSYSKVLGKAEGNNYEVRSGRAERPNEEDRWGHCRVVKEGFKNGFEMRLDEGGKEERTVARLPQCFLPSVSTAVLFRES